MATNDALLKIRALQEATGARLMAFAEAQNLPTESPLGPDWTWMPQDHRVRLLCHHDVRVESLRLGVHYTIWRVKAPLPHLLMTVHFPSLLHREKEDVRLEARFAAKDLRAVETEEAHERSIVVGDFNLDPFDLGLVQADAFHAVSCRRQAQKKYRMIRQRRYPLFYNPGWNCLGDDPAPPGTYYYGKEDTTPYQWRVFDQVLVRPALLDRFDLGRFGVVTEAAGEPFNKKGRPFPSDHFPVKFGLRLGSR